MKFLKALSIALCLISFTMNAQEVVSNGVTYEVKGTSILKNGIDVTETLSEDKKEFIFKKNNENIDKSKRAEKRQKELKKSEKRQKQAEKKRKQAESELKKKEKLQKNLAKVEKDLKRAKRKLKKEKAKGLTTEEALKWESKLEKLLEKKLKAERKLKRS